MGISFWHIVVVILVVVLLFGAGKIPRLMKDMGSGITAFRKGLKENEGGTDAHDTAAAGNPAQLHGAQPAQAEKKPEEAVKRT